MYIDVPMGAYGERQSVESRTGYQSCTVINAVKPRAHLLTSISAGSIQLLGMTHAGCS